MAGYDGESDLRVSALQYPLSPAGLVTFRVVGLYYILFLHTTNGLGTRLVLLGGGACLKWVACLATRAVASISG